MDTGIGTAVAERRVGWTSEWALLGTSVLLFIASVGLLIHWWASMSGGMPPDGMAMSGDMAMSSGWTMSMLWTRLPDQTWLNAAASFMGMWVVMMVAMMLPSLVPALVSYRRFVRGPDRPRLGGRPALVGAGYFSVWLLFGALAYPLGVGLAAAQIQWLALAQLVPVATGVVLLLAGRFQLTEWKAHQLGCCRDVSDTARSLSQDARGAWQYGLRLGIHCSLCCVGLMIILLVIGVMDLGTMTIIAAAITLERLAPRPHAVTRAIGVLMIGAGTIVIGHALGIV